MIDYWMGRLHLHIGKLSDVSMKHRSSILLLSVFVIFIDPGVIITFGSASLAGLGISISPPQEISIGLFLMALLTYRLVAFWATVLLESGTDINRAERKALLEFDPAREAGEYVPSNMEQLIRHESSGTVYKWTKWQIVWELLLPNVIGLVAFSVYAIKYYLSAT